MLNYQTVDLLFFETKQTDFDPHELGDFAPVEQWMEILLRIDDTKQGKAHS